MSLPSSLTFLWNGVPGIGMEIESRIADGSISSIRLGIDS